MEVADGSQLDFGHLIQNVLQDAQTRIVFLAQSIIEEEIRNFSPKPEDLDYPLKIKRGQQDTDRRTATVSDNVVYNETEQFDTETVFQGWYPTLRKCVWLLSKIYRLVNSTVFDDLAHNLVHVTTVSLALASQRIITQKTAIDGKLFLIKHLLLLKEQIVAFDIEFIQPDVNIDFSEITSTFWELREQAGLGVFSPNGILRLMKGALLPKVVANMFDAKVELDVRLRSAINEFTHAFADRMTSPLNPSSHTHTVETRDTMGMVTANIEKEASMLLSQVSEYIEDRRTVETLVSAVQVRLVYIFQTK